MTTFDPSLTKPALIFLGSGAGGLLRYWLGTAAAAAWGTAFPMGTLLINASGCLLMGFLSVYLLASTSMRDDFRAALLIGVLGGYTTFSAFGRETAELLQSGAWGRAVGYALASVVIGVCAVVLGATIAHKLGAASNAPNRAPAGTHGGALVATP